MIYKKNNYNDLLDIKLDKTLVKKNIAVISAEYDAISFFCPLAYCNGATELITQIEQIYTLVIIQNLKFYKVGYYFAIHILQFNYLENRDKILSRRSRTFIMERLNCLMRINFII